MSSYSPDLERGRQSRRGRLVTVAIAGRNTHALIVSFFAAAVGEDIYLSIQAEARCMPELA